MLLVIVILRRRLELLGQLRQHDGEDGVDGFLIGAVSIPHRDQVRVEPDREGDATDVVTLSSSSSSSPSQFVKSRSDDGEVGKIGDGENEWTKRNIPCSTTS